MPHLLYKIHPYEFGQIQLNGSNLTLGFVVSGHRM